jgi:hypothetical protein
VLTSLAKEISQRIFAKSEAKYKPERHFVKEKGGAFWQLAKIR